MATASAPRSSLILVEKKWLRLLTLFLFYLTQGAPIGVILYAIPTWMAGNGASAADTAWVVGIAMLPWSLKLVNGFIIDRYTFLAMGRRRAWVVGAQLLVAIALLTGGVISPDPSDLFVLAAFGFCANVAVTFQDVAIDSLAIDIMPEEERAKAASIMFGAQIIGIAGTTAIVGYLLDNASFMAAMAVASIVPLFVAAYGMAIREREGERRLPWSSGTAHQRNIDIQIEAWWPLLKASMKALSVPLSLILLPLLLSRAVPWGAFESFHPVLATQTAGWSITEYTSLLSQAQFAAGISGLLIGAFIVERLGAQRAAMLYIFIGVCAFLAMGLSQDLWTNTNVLVGMFVLAEFLSTFLAIAFIPICMRMCNPAVAATQFTVYMAVSNFGRPLGATVSGMTAGQDNPTYLYFTVAGLWAITLLVLFIVKFPSENREAALAAEDLPHGDGIPAKVN